MMLIAAFAAAIVAGLLFDNGQSGLCFAFSAIGIVCLIAAAVKYLDGAYNRE